VCPAGGAWASGAGGKAVVDVLVVGQGVEGLPVGYRQVGGRGDGGVLQAALGAPAQLLGVRDGAEVVDGHDRGGQGQLPARRGGWDQLPGAGRGVGGEQGAGAAVAAPGLGDALDLVHRAGGEVAHVQQLHDGAGRAAGRRVPSLGCRAVRGGRARGEGAGVDQTAGVHGQRPAQPGQLGRRRGNVAGGTDDGVRQTAPTTAVSTRVGNTGTDMPAAHGGHPGGRKLVRMKADGPLSAAVVPLDPVAALAAPVALTAAQQPADAVGGYVQGTAHAVDEGAAVPAPGRGRRCGAHAGEPVSQHAGSAAAALPDRPVSLIRCDWSANA